MSNFYLVRKNLTRNKMRFLLNSFAIFMAFLLFGMLASVKDVFDAGAEMTAANRLITVNKINFTQPLPLAYINKIRFVEGVKHAANCNWFGGYYQEPRNQIISFAVDRDSYFDVYNELILSDEARQAWQAKRTGVLVGESLAKTQGWKVGDRIPLSSNIFSQQNGSNVWDTEIVGIFSAKEARADTNYLLMQYKYFIETQTFGGDWIGWVALTTDNPSINEQVAKAIDDQFMNSSAETETTTEKQFAKSFIEQIGDIGFIVTSIVSAAFFTILFIVGNSMALSVRERTAEIAVLKTIGFRASRIFTMVLTESLLLAIIGGLCGLFVAYVLITGAAEAPSVRAVFPNLMLGNNIVIQAVGLMLMLGLVTGILPAWRAMSLNTIEALRRR